MTCAFYCAAMPNELCPFEVKMENDPPPPPHFQRNVFYVPRPFTNLFYVYRTIAMSKCASRVSRLKSWWSPSLQNDRTKGRHIVEGTGFKGKPKKENNPFWRGKCPKIENTFRDKQQDTNTTPSQAPAHRWELDPCSCSVHIGQETWAENMTGL